MHFYRGSGRAAAVYFDEGHRGAEAYYSQNSRVEVEIDTWRGGERIGGPVAAEPGDLIRWVEGVDLGSGQVKGRIREGGEERAPLRFVEVVVNNPKSLSIVASQNAVVAAAVDRVLSAQADGIAGYLSEVAVTRAGGRGAQVEVGGLRVETARVRHLTSREGDPHRHVHLMLNTRVQAPDGSWRGLHSVAVRQHIRAINERANRILLTDVGLRQVLAGEGYTLGADGEIDQARAAVAVMSKRAGQVAVNREAAEAAWRAEHPGREPSQRVRNGWDQAGWAQGRKAKPYGWETPGEMAERVRVELAAAGFDFTPGAHRPVDSGGVPGAAVAVVDRDGVAVGVVAGLSGMKSAWSQADLTAQVEAEVAASGVLDDPGMVAELVADCRVRALERCRSVLDPDVHTPTVMSRHLTSEQVIDADMRLNLGLAGLAGGGGSPDVDAGRAGLVEGLDEGQAAAVAAIAGGRRLEVIVGPAGAGKTRMLAVAKQRLAGQGRELMVVAPTRKGALVAAEEVGGQGAALSKLLYEYGYRWDEQGTWTRLTVGQPDPVSGQVYQGPGDGWGLSGGSVVVVDEAGLATVDQTNALIDVAVESGAAVRLVGDPRQLGAVGRGGVMETAGRWIDGGPIVLDHIHRFVTVGVDDHGLPVTVTDTDYAELSLLLREGDNPGRVADRLAERGALAVHATRSEAVVVIAGTVAALERPEAVAVTVATNNDAETLNQAIRALRVAAGAVDDTVITTGMDGARIGAGDRVATRRNDTSLDVANRETWIVERVERDGSLQARSASGGDRRVCLDAGYVAGAVQLAYAATDYGNQGVTVDASITWVTDATTAGGLYVGATRGRYTNTLHVIAGDLETARGELIAASLRDRADRGLDAARSQAETHATPTVLARPAQVAWSMPDPATWRTAAELDALAARIETDLTTRLERLHERSVSSDNQHQQDNHADRVAAVSERERAARHRSEAAVIQARHRQLEETSIVEFFAARDDARIIDAGPGRFGRKAHQVQAAQDRRNDFARRWQTPQPPGAAWTDNATRDEATRAASRITNADVSHHTSHAERAEQTAAGHDRAIAARDTARRNAITDNRQTVARRAALNERAGQQRAVLDGLYDNRARQTAVMTPEQISIADQARHTYLATQQARQPQPALRGGPQPENPRPGRRPQDIAQQHATRRALLHPPSPTPPGPSLGL